MPITDDHREAAAPSRRAALLAAGGLLALPLAACGGPSGSADVASGDDILGDPNAPVKIIEYASPTCIHCKLFHDDVLPELKARYIDSGKACLVFREIPTPPAPLSVAGYLAARCAPEEKFFDVLDVLFDRQEPLRQAFAAGAARDDLVRIAAAAGVPEEQLDACLRDDQEIERIRRLGQEGASRFGVTGTPTFVINGRRVDYQGEITLEQLAQVLDPLLEG